MNSRDFNRVLNRCTKKVIDPAKLASLPWELRREMVYRIVRYRGPVLAALCETELETDNAFRSWFCSCGYLYQSTGPESGLTFYHTSETEIR